METEATETCVVAIIALIVTAFIIWRLVKSSKGSHYCSGCSRNIKIDCSGCDPRYAGQPGTSETTLEEPQKK